MYIGHLGMCAYEDKHDFIVVQLFTNNINSYNSNNNNLNEGRRRQLMINE